MDQPVGHLRRRVSDGAARELAAALQAIADETERLA